MTAGYYITGGLFAALASQLIDPERRERIGKSRQYLPGRTIAHPAVSPAAVSPAGKT